ncbi:hypothetical protein [Curtobacterium flaccumfaciens]|uniref:hypothetical protein n=1 Tax=Curtobacterium flaccumfaciens TaxID=2035 RepID=UPI00217DEF26|nr:hypothetical protein [Curtobacterium flaccumfaciens]MCS6550954.1 hypothetical protein [Curtobacterium flaccumfaciens pv. flaccumfaciens]
MASWDVDWSEPGAPGSRVVSCLLTRRGGLAHQVELVLSTTDSEVRQPVPHGPGPQRPLAENGTLGFDVTLPGADLATVGDGPIKFDAPNNDGRSALVVTVQWSDTADGPRQERAFIYRPITTSH